MAAALPSIVRGKIPVLGKDEVSLPSAPLGKGDTEAVLRTLAKASPGSAAGGPSSSSAGASASSASSSAASSAGPPANATAFMFQHQTESFCMMHSANHLLQTLGKPLITTEEYKTAIDGQKAAYKRALEDMKTAYPSKTFQRDLKLYMEDTAARLLDDLQLDQTVQSGPLDKTAFRYMLSRRGLALVPRYFPKLDAVRAAGAISALPMPDTIDYARGNFYIAGYWKNEPTLGHAVCVTQNLYIDSGSDSVDVPDVFSPARWLTHWNSISSFTNKQGKFSSKKGYIDREVPTTVEPSLEAMEEGLNEIAEVQPLEEKTVKRPRVVIINPTEAGYDASITVQGPKNSTWVFNLGYLPPEYGLLPYKQDRSRRGGKTVIPSLPDNLIVTAVWELLPLTELPRVEQEIQARYGSSFEAYKELVSRRIAWEFQLHRERQGPKHLDFVTYSYPVTSDVRWAVPGPHGYKEVQEEQADGEIKTIYKPLKGKEYMMPLLAEDTKEFAPWLFGSGMY